MTRLKLLVRLYCSCFVATFTGTVKIASLKAATAPSDDWNLSTTAAMLDFLKKGILKICYFIILHKLRKHVSFVGLVSFHNTQQRLAFIFWLIWVNSRFMPTHYQWNINLFVSQYFPDFIHKLARDELLVTLKIRKSNLWIF